MRTYGFMVQMAVSVTLLFTLTTAESAHSSLGVGSEEVIQLELSEGQWSLNINYWGALFGEYQSDGCDVITMEASIVPKDNVLARVAQFQCPPSTLRCH